MGRASFLDKFATRADSARASGKKGHSELEHVVRNLEAVLNTKEGYGFFRRDFGLGEYTEKYGTRELVETLTRELTEEISRHEPRLSDVELTMRGRDAGLWLHFGLVGTVGQERRKLRLRFDTLSGNVRVEEEP
ncbi:type VI secretion system baseplate subunit TssE [Myxococcus sp. MISCRS1]|jgi:type VI secretion system protein|uniref:type VI secretion system baseplate subunit TssE n=1 Tax=Myxococcus TaxID=32 RepID=UPI00114283DD|nr:MULTISPECIES: type VI secretion system baseplate subunit TssE [Myxococcus]BDT33672.1 type VI secretion system baseplate subunit TssE [Myxococcus sp. MH1]MBZ4396700.1 type VI secretion system baseplate subunit TssE [Myxococcus sp. AS-1-15]MBZ4408574.1 type VI secretion system baseplate subunit TssE [Myxococcus sp. XM-1-1-1]MCK8496522.1 type VI secretion system baseplate subunit TssE [Myxococcus fulvus]MCY0996305.1 type VI secretion system baseplate subunit TssE [Myxococcus sp. MISCRS1]